MTDRTRLEFELDVARAEPAGHAARFNDVPMRACPHADGGTSEAGYPTSLLRQSWERGWKRADRELSQMRDQRYLANARNDLREVLQTLIHHAANGDLHRCMREDCRRLATYSLDAGSHGAQYACDIESHRTTDYTPLRCAKDIRRAVGAIDTYEMPCKPISTDKGHRTVGLHQKYVLAKRDGSPVDPAAVYFPLRLDSDPYARIGARAYADAVRPANPRLAADLDALLGPYEDRRDSTPDPDTHDEGE